jgi:hypothetical protein
MENYANKSGKSGISEYEICKEYIRVKFRDGHIYRYGYSHPGREKVEYMKKLAENGIGLNSYISKYIKKDYEEKEC